ncbi:HDOD domain-containing protein [Hydrogenovibrio kuenenii]|uniref:HDOD domain-containing protein n=1 Tax=Hydrogenovibrio kuenenii TaxID=63658 RepID=UPI000464A918|nr:HDOD domain-containing protein [Hydrogenovibrio kuenenii]
MELKDQLVQARVLLNKTEKISIPREVLKLRQLLAEQEFPNAQEMAHIIGQNAILAGEIVQAANLPSMHGKNYRVIHTIHDAIDILGVRRLRNLVTAISLKLGLENFGHKQLIKHSIKVAEACAEIAKMTGVTTGDGAYLLGLFHNIGAIMMTKLDPNYENIFAKSLSSPFSTNQAELDTYRTSHGLVGVLVADEWELDTPFKKTMILHHEPNLDSIRNPELKQLVALIQLANGLVSEQVFQVYMTPELKEMIERSQQVLNLSDDQLNELRKAIT